MRAKSGFTLVEILIVLVILGILAAIVIPQFTSASTEAKESALVSDLQAVRSQIELYKVQHNDNLPGVANGTHIAGGGFASAMTTATDQDGNPGGRFGPYIQRIPDNPFSTAVGQENAVGTGTAKKNTTTVGDNSTGWWFVTSGADAGLFQANDNKSNELVDPIVPHTAY
ncbi:MAG: prepilin-type N-terminal cleavage/methylation domain-containing protein [Sedimentisphaerales bacterium]